MAKCLEIPPRVRRRDPEGNRQHLGHGNTSACAEKSAGVIFDFWLLRKYLRVCGEEPGRAARFQPSREIPPRVRRRGTTCQLPRNPGGNTSACAEKSRCRAVPNDSQWKYLRVCGEEQIKKSLGGASGEIPPRVRRRVSPVPLRCVLEGNTSACAEKSAPPTVYGWLCGKYLRVCGEEIWHGFFCLNALEIPPRVRRRVPHV